MPAAFSAATCEASITVPFFSTSSPLRMVWTAVAPIASLGRDRAEFHAAFSGATCRSRAVICAMIETAISGGETAPISSPIGA